MLKKLWQHKRWLSIAAGTSVFLAFPCFYIVPTILFFPALTIRSALLAQNRRQAFGVGFLTSFFVMVGGFYWVTYVLHAFGDMNWAFAVLLFLGFCGFGALNFPLFTWAIYEIETRFKISRLSDQKIDLWYAVGYPALFALVEYACPKLFPWYLGHCLYQAVWSIQIAEFTGSLIFSFALMSMGGILFRLARYAYLRQRVPASLALAFPFALWGVMLMVSADRLRKPIEGHPFRVALVQANIGSLDKLAAERGYENKMRYTLDVYLRLTNQAMQLEPRPDLVLWPETAMPFQMEYESQKYPQEVRRNVLLWNVPLITGGYGIDPLNFNTDYNTAFLLEPGLDNRVKLDRYHKNILLAFGEYMPLGETFPSLYRKFPAVSNFSRGKIQNSFSLSSDVKLGVTICYEDIMPSFFRKVAQNDINAVVNLTNDSWFGPTAEPYLHGAITIFRAIETRKPLYRVTNTGTSFTVDQNGRLSPITKVYEEDLLISDTILADASHKTFYVRYGDWFVVVLLLTLAALIFERIRRRNVPIPL